MAKYKFDNFRAVISDPTIVKNGHSGGVFKNDNLIGYYSDVELKTNGLVDSITLRFESDEMPDFATYPNMIDAIDNWIDNRMNEHLIEE